MKYSSFILFLICSGIMAQEKEYLPEKQDHVLILTAKGSIFDQARNGLLNEIRDDFSTSVLEITEKSTIENIDTLVKVFNIPKAVILIGNNAIRLYTKYSDSYKEKTKFIQVISILALDVQRAVAGIENATCIAYETPMVTALVNFRRVFNRPLNKVGVLYRKPIREFVEKHTIFCSKEKIEIKGIEIGDDPSKHVDEISKALQILIKKEHVDALWLANDNVLLKPNLLGNAWLPQVKNKKIPIIAGVEALVSTELNFGTFAVIPDPVALGEQAAEHIYDLQADDWKNSGVEIHPAISMYSVLNLKKATEIVSKDNIKIYEVSKVLDGKK